MMTSTCVSHCMWHPVLFTLSANSWKIPVNKQNLLHSFSKQIVYFTDMSPHRTFTSSSFSGTADVLYSWLIQIKISRFKKRQTILKSSDGWSLCYYRSRLIILGESHRTVWLVCCSVPFRVSALLECAKCVHYLSVFPHCAISDISEAVYPIVLTGTVYQLSLVAWKRTTYAGEVFNSFWINIVHSMVLSFYTHIIIKKFIFRLSL